MRRLFTPFLALALLASACGDDTVSGGGTTPTSGAPESTTTTTETPADLASTLADLADDAVVLERSVYLGLPRPDDPPSLRLEVLKDGSARAWDNDRARYVETTLDPDSLAGVAEEIAEAADALDEYYENLEFSDCGGGAMGFRDDTGELRRVSWDCDAPEDGSEVLALYRSLAEEVLAIGTAPAIDTASLDGLSERAVLAVATTTAAGCTEPRFVLQAGGQITVNRRTDSQLGTWEIGRDAAMLALAAVMEAARAAETDGEIGLIVHGVVGRVPQGPLTIESIDASSPELIELLQELESPPDDAVFRAPDRLFLSTGPSVDDPRTVDPLAPALEALGEFAIVPSNRSPWTREIEGDLIAEFLTAAGPGRSATPGQAWIAVPGVRSGVPEPVAASLTCFRPVIDGFDPEYGISSP